MKLPSRQDVLEVDRSARRGRLDDKEAWITLARLLDELAVAVGTGLDLLVEKVQGDRLSRPPWRQVGLGIGHEGEGEERIERRPELAGTVYVVGNRVPEEEFLLRLGKGLIAEFVGGVRKEGRDQHAFRGAESHTGCVLGVKSASSSV
jgi:hypothetical protein